MFLAKEFGSLLKSSDEISLIERLDINEEEKNIKNTKKEEVKPKEIEKAKAPSPKTKTEEKQSVKKKASKKAHQSVRVDLERIDKLMNMVSEIVIYRTRLEQIVVDNKSPEL